MAEAGYDDDTIARTVDNCWAWRNIVVADTDAEAEAIGVPAFRRMREHLNSARRRLNLPERATAHEQRHRQQPGRRWNTVWSTAPRQPSATGSRHSKSGIGGLILHFRLGPMPWDVTEHSLRLFAEKVAPEFRATVAR